MNKRKLVSSPIEGLSKYPKYNSPHHIPFEIWTVVANFLTHPEIGLHILSLNKELRYSPYWLPLFKDMTLVFDNPKKTIPQFSWCKHYKIISGCLSPTTLFDSIETITFKIDCSAFPKQKELNHFPWLSKIQFGSNLKHVTFDFDTTTTRFSKAKDLTLTLFQIKNLKFPNTTEITVVSNRGLIVGLFSRHFKNLTWEYHDYGSRDICCIFHEFAAFIEQKAQKLDTLIFDGKDFCVNFVPDIITVNPKYVPLKSTLNFLCIKNIDICMDCQVDSKSWLRTFIEYLLSYHPNLKTLKFENMRILQPGFPTTVNKNRIIKL